MLLFPEGNGLTKNRDPGIILSVLVAQLVGRLGGDGFWNGDYGWGVRVCRHFGARGRSSVRYGTRLGDLEENWFLLFSKHSTHTPEFGSTTPEFGSKRDLRVTASLKP